MAEGKWFDMATQDVTSVSLNDKDLNKLLLFILKKLKIGEEKVKIYDDTILFCQDFKEQMLEGTNKAGRKLIAQSVAMSAMLISGF